MLGDHRKAQVIGMNGPMITKILTASVIAVMLLAFASPVVAQEEEFYYQRAIAEQYTTEKATIVSAAVTPQGSDWLIFVLDTIGDEEKGLGVGVLYGHGTEAGQNEYATGSFIAPFGIVEYVDDGDGKYDLAGDDVVSMLPLHADLDDHEGFYEQTGESDSTMTWYERPGYKNIKHGNMLGPAGAEAITIAAETEDGVFELIMHVTNSVIFNETVVLSPYEVKIDFIIEDYPFVANNTEIALLQIIAVGNAKWYNGLPEEYSDAWKSSVEEGGWSFDIEGGAGYFSWLKNATVDGEDVDVKESTLARIGWFNWTPEGSTRIDLKYVAFAYGRGDSIIHDPKIGFAFTDGLPPVFVKLVRGSIGLFVASLLIFGTVIYAAKWSRKRSATPKRIEGMQTAPPVQQMPPQQPPQTPPQMPPQTPPQMPPQAPPGAPPQGGAPPSYPPGTPPGGAQQGQMGAPADPRYGYRPPGQ